jgi:hypothetical protein
MVASVLSTDCSSSKGLQKCCSIRLLKSNISWWRKKWTYCRCFVPETLNYIYIIISYKLSKVPRTLQFGILLNFSQLVCFLVWDIRFTNKRFPHCKYISPLNPRFILPVIGLPDRNNGPRLRCDIMNTIRGLSNSMTFLSFIHGTKSCWSELWHFSHP